MSEFLAAHWGVLLVSLMAFVKIIVDLTATEKDNKIFGYIDSFISYFLIKKKK